MANPWFRMYAEFAHDQKVQMLSEADQRRLLMLFCLRCNGCVTLLDEEVTFQLRISNESWQTTKTVFISRGFINEHNEVLNWDKRQFTSDTSKNRVAAYRERKRQVSNDAVTLQVTKSNAVEQNRTEQNINTPRINALDESFEKFWIAYPKKKAKDAALKAWKKTKPSLDEILQALSWQKISIEWKKDNGQFIPYPASYLNAGAWKDEPLQNKTRGLQL